VVNSPRQLWSVGGYLDMVIEGVFGLGADGRSEPKLPASLLPMLFGDNDRIALQLRGRRITLQRPPTVSGNLLVASDVEQHGNETVVTLKAIHVDTTPQRLDAPLFAPATPAAPQATRAGSSWKISFSGYGQLYVDGKVIGAIDGQRLVPASTAQQCFSVTGRAGELESLPSPATCVGPVQHVAGAWPRTWTAPVGGRFRATLVYANDHGPINTGITAAVKNLVVECDGAPTQTRPVVMPHSRGMQASTDVIFSAPAGAPCHFSIHEGFNMSFLRHFAHYTGGQGGIEGPLNEARVGDLLIAPLAGETP
jgi:hypothetical protein